MSQLDNSGQVSPTPPLTTLLSGPQSRVIGDKTLQNQSVWKSETMKQTRWCSNIPVLSIYKLIDCLCIRWGEVGLKLETVEKEPVSIRYSHTTHQSSHLSGYSEIEIRPRKHGGVVSILERENCTFVSHSSCSFFPRIFVSSSSSHKSQICEK